MDGNGAAATGDEEQNRGHVANWQDSFGPFSEGFDVPDDFGEEEPGDLGTGGADALPRSGLGRGAASASSLPGGLGRGASTLAGGLAGAPPA
jgi:hypothetical protein